MTTLTESIVLSRSRADDLSSVRKLNCWGSELGDVALLRHMKSVEVLSLSVNKIKTLADFAHCPNLQELYIRKNEIMNLGDVLYLTELKKLRSLWLADNPCADCDNYRLTVLKYLPKLQKLDNIVVKPEEVQDSMMYGGTLSLHQGGGQNERTNAPSPPPRHQSPNRQADDARAASPPKPRSHRGPPEYDSEPVRDENRNINNSVQRIPQSESMNSLEISEQKMQYSPSYQAHQLASPNQPQQPHPDSHYVDEANHPQAFQARVQTLVEHSRMPGHQQAHVEQNQVSSNMESASMPAQHHSFDGIVHTCHEHGSFPAENGHRHSVSFPTGHAGPHISLPRSHSSGERSSPTRAFTGRGKNRNSNILSAVLCLIKELDYASLEVVETAVQCRMLELEDYHSP